VHHVRRNLSDGLLESGRCIRIRREELFHIHLIPDHTGVATGRIELDLDMLATGLEPDWDVLASAFSESSRGFGLALTQAMFQLPWYTWNLETVATRIKTTRRCVQAKLFREAYSFCSALHRCRQLHSLLL
jgi:hypothetical protein